MDLKKISEFLESANSTKEFKNYILKLVPVAIELKNKFNAHIDNSSLYKYNKGEEILDILF